MSDIEKAKQLFANSGLAFPTIPVELAVKLKEQGPWLFSTCALKMSPYNLHHYVHELDAASDEEYAVLCHSGHGANSYAIQFYLVYGPLRSFLHLGWGGVYMDADAAASGIGKCFSLADEILSAVMTVGKLGACEPLTIVGSDFYGSYWSAPGQSRQEESTVAQSPAEVLAQALDWLKNPPLSQPSIRDKIKRLEGRILQTLSKEKPFIIVEVTAETVRLVPQLGKRKDRTIQCGRIEHLAGMGLQRDELRREVQKEYPESHNASYYAAIVHEIAGS